MRKGRSGRQEGIGDKASDEIDEEINGSPVARMLNLTGIFKEIIDRFNDSALSKHQFVRKIHQNVFHVFLKFCN